MYDVYKGKRTRTKLDTKSLQKSRFRSRKPHPGVSKDLKDKIEKLIYSANLNRPKSGVEASESLTLMIRKGPQSKLQEQIKNKFITSKP